MLSERGRLNLDLQKILDSQTDAWRIKVSDVEADITGSAKPARSSFTNSPSRLLPSTVTLRTDMSWPSGGSNFM